ncbi:MAG: hypothetical protein JW867_08855 [Candidatus Omnitrophica bacterium]|nr:hypothetical protein [Candidatus Omnitrophota bacterium]
MEAQERKRLKEIYENEVSDQDLAELAMTDPKEFEQGVFELVIEAAKKRGILEKLEEVKAGQRQTVSDERLIEIYSYKQELEKEAIKSFFKDKNINVDIVSREDYLAKQLNIGADCLGVIRVKESDLEKAKVLLDDFNTDNNLAQEEEELIFSTVREVLLRRGIDDNEGVAREIARAIREIYY